MSFSLIILDSVVKVKKKYYPQIVLEECKYETKKTKIENLINDELEWSFMPVYRRCNDFIFWLICWKLRLCHNILN